MSFLILQNCGFRVNYLYSIYWLDPDPDFSCMSGSGFFLDDFLLKVGSMVLKLDGNSEIGAHVCYLICLRHLIRSKAVTIRILS